jgi:phosphoglycolate phosphatase-like HAD superfamily hydrolase
MVHELTVMRARGIPSGLRAAVFDYDDTLADTTQARVLALRRTFELLGITTVDADAFMIATRGIPFQAAFDAYDGGTWKGLGMMDVYRRTYWAKERGLLSLFDGVSELLYQLRTLDVRMGIVTSKARDIVVAERDGGVLVELDELSLNWLAPFTIGFEDVRQHKPHPEGLQRLLNMLGVSPQETLVVGDSVADIQLALNAGCWSCLAGWGVPEAERQLTVATPDVVAEHPLALLPLFSQRAPAGASV